MGWIKDAYDAARMIRDIRKQGWDERIIMRIESEQILDEKWLSRLGEERNRLYQCVEDMGKGKSRCPYCEDYRNCDNKKKGKVRGCEEWTLAWEANDEQAGTAEAGQTGGEETKLPFDDEGTGAGADAPAGDHAGRPQG